MGLAKASLYLLATSSALLGAGVAIVAGRVTGWLSVPPASIEASSRSASSRRASPAGALDYDSFDDDVRYDNYDPLTIAPGELPGYTGWARPERTLAGSFRIVSAAPAGPVSAGREWSVVVRCSAPACRKGGAHFYLRAYGPAVITGAMQDNGDGSYRAAFYPADPGRYAVEVVLAFSNAPEFEEFPLANGEEPGFEGYLLPGFPLRMTVVAAAGAEATAAAESPRAAPPSEEAARRRLGGGDGAASSSRRSAEAEGPRRPWCSFEQLVETDGSGGGLRSGRWKVADRVQGGTHRPVTSDPKRVTLRGYQETVNSLGVAMRYTPNDCDLLPESSLESKTRGEHLVDRCLLDAGINNGSNGTDPAGGRAVRVVLIGDSVMRLQEEALRRLLRGSSSLAAGRVRVSRIKTYGGISRTLANVTSELRALQEANPKERRIVIFNSALHDVDRLCSAEMRGSRRVHFPNMTDAELVCIQFYEELLEQLADVVAEHPAELRVFRSANAGWPKYGNFGFAWPTAKPQLFSRSPNFVAKINDVAYRVLSKREEIHIVDGYWMSLPRPDNTEIGSVNTIGKHMVHPGLEVVGAMTMKVLMLALRQICSRTMDDWA